MAERPEHAEPAGRQQFIASGEGIEDIPGAEDNRVLFIIRTGVKR